MKFLTVEINTLKKHRYERLLNAWENSVITNMPHADYERIFLDPKHYPQCRHANNGYVANSVKLNYWSNKIKEETGDICLIDGDTLVLKDVEHVFDLDFDIAYTIRTEGAKMPINGGVLFVRPSEIVSDFFEKWKLTNNEMLVNKTLHRPWHRVFQGINQASLGCMLKHYDKKIKIISLPCSKYNACDPPDWEGINEDTHILHVKSMLRQAVLDGINIKKFSEAIKIWKKYENSYRVRNPYLKQEN